MIKTFGSTCRENENSRTQYNIGFIQTKIRDNGSNYITITDYDIALSLKLNGPVLVLS